MAFKGIGTADGGGDTIFTCANTLRSCGYEVCLLMDADLPKDDEKKAALKEIGVAVFDWDKPNALEEQVFYDVPTDVATKIINIAVTEHGMESVKSRLTSEKIPFVVADDEIQLVAMTPDEQKKIGEIAKRKKVEWYKRIDLGEQLGNAVFDNWEYIGAGTKIKSVVDALSKWVIGND